MRKGLFFLFFLLATFRVEAISWASMNYDAETIAAITDAFAMEEAEEALYSFEVDSILKSYISSEIASAGIYASKYLDRKALKSVGELGDESTNYYYKRIYSLVSAKIMPKIWTVAKLMIHSPLTALYWGSYLSKICSETETLCKEFEAVVTNSTLSFKDIVFLQVSQELQDVFSMGGASSLIKDMAGSFSLLSDDATRETLRASIDNLYSLGVGIASSGEENMLSLVMEQNPFSSLINSNLSSLLNVVDNVEDLFNSYDGSRVKDLLSSFGVSTEAGVGNLFSLSSYDMSSWISKQEDESLNEYYTQPWYIYAKDSGSEIIYSYIPAQEDEDILSGSEWVRISTSNTAYTLSEEEKERVLSNSESYAGFSRSTVEELNKLGDGYTYTFKSTLLSCGIYSKNAQKQRAFAYELWIEKSWDSSLLAYEDTYDSYLMDLSTFLSIMDVHLTELNNNEEGIIYTLASGEKKYYSLPSTQKLEAIEQVTISATCHSGTDMASGNTQYKCRQESSALSEHTKTCAMSSSVDEGDMDFSELYASETEQREKIQEKEAEIQETQAEISRLSELIASSASSMEVASYRQQLNEEKDKLSFLNLELDALNAELQDILSAINEAVEGEEEQTNDYYRIPAIMNDCKALYNLEWKADGTWDGYTYTRKATTSSATKADVTFTAELSMQRKPKYFLGILIHRAIIKIEWSLSSDFENTSVIETITLDSSLESQEKRDLIQNRLTELSKDYPDCELSVEYKEKEGLKEDTDSNETHFLWASNRLEIARKVDARLTQIYATLVAMEKMMHYRVNVINVLSSVEPYVNQAYGKRKTLLDEAISRWTSSSYKAVGRKAPGSKVETP